MFFTPPYAPAAYAAGTLANASPIKVGFQAMRLGIVAYLIPVVICYNTDLLLVGNVFDILVSVITAVIGIVIIAAALEGFLLTKLNAIQRVLLGVGGILAFIPNLMVSVIGIIIIVFVVASNIMQYKKKDKKVEF